MNYVLSENTARKLRVLLRGSGDSSLLSVNNHGIGNECESPAPWTIDYSHGENSGSGAFVIWLPGVGSFKELKASGGTLDAAFTTMLGTLTNCQVRTGWKILPVEALSSLQTVYLNVNQASATPVMSISLSAVSGSISIPIAVISNSSTTGIVEIKQLQVGEIEWGGGTETTAMSRAFDISRINTSGGSVPNKVVNCKIYVGNQWMTCQDYNIDLDGGDIYLHVTRGTNGYTISVDQTFTAETSTTISVKLWEFSNREPTLDVRPGFIPCFAI